MRNGNPYSLPMNTATTPAAILTHLDANVDAFYSDAIAFAEFGKRNRRIWADAEGAGVTAEVERLLRERV